MVLQESDVASFESAFSSPPSASSPSPSFLDLQLAVKEQPGAGTEKHFNRLNQFMKSIGPGKPESKAVVNVSEMEENLLDSPPLSKSLSSLLGDTQHDHTIIDVDHVMALGETFTHFLPSGQLKSNL